MLGLALLAPRGCIGVSSRLALVQKTTLRYCMIKSTWVNVTNTAITKVCGTNHKKYFNAYVEGTQILSTTKVEQIRFEQNTVITKVCSTKHKKILMPTWRSPYFEYNKVEQMRFEPNTFITKVCRTIYDKYFDA
jgi:uncharacterized protein YraI